MKRTMPTEWDAHTETGRKALVDLGLDPEAAITKNQYSHSLLHIRGEDDKYGFPGNETVCGQNVGQENRTGRDIEIYTLTKYSLTHKLCTKCLKLSISSPPAITASTSSPPAITASTSSPTMTTAWNKEQLYSSKKQDWATPQALFDALHEEFNFGLDAAANNHNAKCSLFIDTDSLSQDWAALCPESHAVWLNPPYGRKIGPWIEKAYRESLKGCCVVVLVFARTDVKWWGAWAKRAAQIITIEGRIRFEGASSSAPAPSCLLVFDEERRVPLNRYMSDLPRR